MLEIFVDFKKFSLAFHYICFSKSRFYVNLMPKIIFIGPTKNDTISITNRKFKYFITLFESSPNSKNILSLLLILHFYFSKFRSYVNLIPKIIFISPIKNETISKKNRKFQKKNSLLFYFFA